MLDEPLLTLARNRRMEGTYLGMSTSCSPACRAILDRPLQVGPVFGLSPQQRPVGSIGADAVPEEVLRRHRRRAIHWLGGLARRAPRLFDASA